MATAKNPEAKPVLQPATVADATPAATQPEPMPEAGGSYTRLPDGTLNLTNHYED